MDKKVCRGCGTSVAKPILCDICGTASHPGCITRSRHPCSNGRFLPCDVAITDPSDVFMSKIRDLIRSEFAKLREEIANLYGADIERITRELQDVNKRITEVERGISNAPASQRVTCEDVLGEISERERRSRNLIFFNVEENEAGSTGASGDLSLASEVVQVIIPNNPPRITTRRLGGVKKGHPRPLLVSFSSKAEVVRVLKSRSVYMGPVNIRQDLTEEQRSHLRGLRMQLESLRCAGITDKTIRYFDGVPKIVKSRPNSKNASVAL